MIVFRDAKLDRSINHQIKEVREGCGGRGHPWRVVRHRACVDGSREDRRVSELGERLPAVQTREAEGALPLTSQLTRLSPENK